MLLMLIEVKDLHFLYVHTPLVQWQLISVIVIIIINNMNLKYWVYITLASFSLLKLSFRRFPRRFALQHFLGFLSLANSACLMYLFNIRTTGYEEVQKNHWTFLSRRFNFESKQYSVLFSTPQLISSELKHTNPSILSVLFIGVNHGL
jgi:hypothetical protein